MLGRVSLHTSVVACALVGLLALGPSAGARRAPTPQAVALKAIAHLAGLGRIDAAEASADRTAVARAVRLIDLLPRDRAAPVASALAQVSALAGRLTAPRALALFGQLTVNDDWFAEHGPPSPQSDTTGADGVVYRYFPGAAFEFHPLANFAALNGDATSKNVAKTTALAAALEARGVPEPGGGVGWEYDFDYSGGNAPWLSGFAQVIAAQAFARAAGLLTDQTTQLMAEANAAYRTVHDGLLQYPSFGPWIRLYGFNHDVVLNAQLQTSISLASYAALAGNSQAATLATSMRNAAAAALPHFDTGYWTYYSLAGNPSPLSYQEYVVQLLKTLAKTDPRFAAAATRFATYQTEPPLFKLAGAGVGAVEFWVSKPATVRISALGSTQQLSVSGGWHVVTWDPGHAGIFPVSLHATDWAGNSGSAQALPIVRVAAAPRPHAKAKAKAKAKVKHAPLVRAATALPPLVVAAGLDTPGEASLAHTDGFAADQMTLVWPSGSSSPTASTVAALDGLPAGSELVLELDASALPVDAPGRAALASYAAALASQVPALHDLVVGPAATLADAADDEAALAAVYDAVHEVAPSVEVDGDLDGATAPAQTLAAVAAAYRESGRTAPLLDALAFRPAASGAAGWSLTDLPTLVSALGSDFAGTAQTGASLPLIVDDIAVASAIPQAKLALYPPSAATTGVSETAQAAAYSATLSTAGCQSTVVAVILDRLVDGTSAGEQSGLYYADGSAKTSLAAVLQTVAQLQGPSRTCTPAAPQTTPTPGAATTTTTAPTPASSGSLATLGALVFPTSVSTSGAPRVHVGCSRACLYLVTLQRASDGAPVLATRGALGAGSAATVTLPHDPVTAGRYRFAVWLIGQDNPGTVEVERSTVVDAGAT